MRFLDFWNTKKDDKRDTSDSGASATANSGATSGADAGDKEPDAGKADSGSWWIPSPAVRVEQVVVVMGAEVETVVVTKKPRRAPGFR